MQLKKFSFLVSVLTAVFCCSGLSAQPAIVTDSLRRIINLHQQDTNEVVATYMLARYTKWSDTEGAMALAKEALNLSKKLDYNSGKIYSYNTIGIILQDKGEFNTSLVYLDSSLTLARELNDSMAIGMSLNNIGLVQLEQGSYESSLTFLLESATIRDKIGDVRGAAGSLNNIGLLYGYMNEHQKAIEYYTKSMALKQQLGDKQGIANTYLNIGLSYDGLKDTAQERANYRKALELYEELGDLNGQAMVYNNFGEIWLHEKQFERSLTSHYHAYSLRVELEDRIGLVQSGTNIAACLIQLDSLDKAQQFLDESIIIAQSENDKEELALAYSVQSDLFVAKGDFESALTAFKISAAIQDSMLNEQSTKNVQALEAKYQAEKKEKEILLLQAAAEQEENRKKLIITISIAAMLVFISAGWFYFSRYKSKQHQLRELAVMETKQNERIRIARDMHDDLGSGLTRISLLSEQVKSQVTKGSQDISVSNLEKLTNESRQLTRNLGEIVWTLSPKNDRLGDLAAYIRNHAYDFLEEAGINCVTNFPDEIPDLIIKAEARRNVFLCVKESLNNIAKYSGAVRVDLRMIIDQDKFTLTIHDNGKGFNITELKRINGLNNMRKRAQDCGGELIIDSAPGQGTKVILSGIPLSHTTIV